MNVYCWSAWHQVGLKDTCFTLKSEAGKDPTLKRGVEPHASILSHFNILFRRGKAAENIFRDCASLWINNWEAISDTSSSNPAGKLDTAWFVFCSTPLETTLLANFCSVFHPLHARCLVDMYSKENVIKYTVLKIKPLCWQGNLHQYTSAKTTGLQDFTTV